MASTTSLLQSAAATREAIANRQDQLEALEYRYSGHTDEAYQKYQAYLNKRVSSLSAAGGVSNASKAISLSNTLMTATSQNISYGIQVATNQVTLSNAPLTVKRDALIMGYNRAKSIGDNTLAMRLAGDIGSVNQSIQQQQIQAAKDAETLAKANEDSIKKGYSSAVDEVKNSAIDIFANIHSGAVESAQVLKDATVKINSVLKNLGQEPLPENAKPNLGSIVQGVMNVQAAYFQSAANAIRPYDPAAADSYAQYDNSGNLVGGKLYSIVSNQAYVTVPGLGNVNYSDAKDIADHPNRISIVTNERGQVQYKWNPVTGYDFNGEPITEANRMQALATITDPSDMERQLTNLGFGKIKFDKASGSFTATLTDKTDNWIGFGGKNRNLLSTSENTLGNTITLIPQANGAFELKQGNKVYGIGLDNNGLGGLFQITKAGATNLAGQHGFDQKVNNVVAPSTPAVSQNTPVRGTTVTPSMNKTFQPVVQTPSSPKGPQMVQRKGGGFNFVNNGVAISAASYAQLTHTQFRTLLQSMANQGDTGAKQVLNFVGNDFGYDPGKINNGNNANLYNAMVWGTGRSAPTLKGNIQNGKLTLPSGFQL